MANDITEPKHHGNEFSSDHGNVLEGNHQNNQLEKGTHRVVVLEKEDFLTTTKTNNKLRSRNNQPRED